MQRYKSFSGIRGKRLQTREKQQKVASNFSNQLSLSFNWFDEHFKKNIEESFRDFWEKDFDAKFFCLSENINFLGQNEEFFVTKIRLNKELSVFVRLSKDLVKNLLENILGSNGKKFDIAKLSELEAKILTGFNNFLYKSFSPVIKPADELPKNNTNYNEYNLTFFVESCGYSLGKLVLKIPVVAINPEKLSLGEERFTIDNFLDTTAPVNLSVGSTKIRLNDLKNLEKDDIVLLEHSKASRMILKYDGHTIQMRVTPNPGIMIDYDIEESGAGSGGEKYMSSNNYNMWDTIQVEIGAEFEKVKLTLGELKQISEGLVVDIGSVYDNKIDLKVEDKIVASGELVIINDRYGVKINHIFTEEKNLASQNVEEAQHERQIEEVPAQEESYSEEQQPQEIQEPPAQHGDELNEEDFDYSDFDVDEEDI